MKCSYDDGGRGAAGFKGRTGDCVCRAVATSTACLCDELVWLRSRYDTGAVAPAVYATIKKLEEEIAWREHAELTDPRRGADQRTA
jgi:hypothetical protein